MLKQELSARFALVSDSMHALTLLGRIRQGRNENVQIFAERLLNLAQQAFQDQGGPVMEQQLIGFFIDGLVSNAIKMRILRESPNTFQDAIKMVLVGKTQNQWKSIIADHRGLVTGDQFKTGTEGDRDMVKGSIKRDLLIEKTR